MKAWTDLKSIATPPAIEALPKDARGYPIPYFAGRKEDGSPDFRVVDKASRIRCMSDKVCSICGGRIRNELIAFVGGPRSAQNRVFVDGPMHKSCAQYALKACPMLAVPSYNYARATPDGAETIEAVIPQRPDYYALGLTAGYALHKFDTVVVMRANPWASITYWRDGQQLKEKPHAEDTDAQSASQEKPE